MDKIQVAIEGGAGYTAGELIRILLNHPAVEIKYINSESHQGQEISKVHKDLSGDTSLSFGTVDYSLVDVVFLCKGHGKSQSFLKETVIPERVKIIDLSTDFRDESDGFVYSLPEWNHKKIKKCKRLANPGCFATSVQLALLPLAANGLLCSDVHITSITGSTGSGQSLSETSHFSWRNNNISVYKPLKHQHLKEINRNISIIQPDYSGSINLITMRGNFTRGIFSSMYTQCNLEIQKVKALFSEYYSEHPFVRVVDEMPDLKQVVNTNKCILYLEKIDDKIYIVSMIDNLLKGASGQAVQNMNLMFGFDETMGLKLKGIGF